MDGNQMRELIGSLCLLEQKLEKIGYSSPNALSVTWEIGKLAHRSLEFVELINAMAESVVANNKHLVWVSTSLLRRSVWDFTQYVKEHKPIERLASEIGIEPAEIPSRVEIQPSEMGEPTASWLKEVMRTPLPEQAVFESVAGLDSEAATTVMELLTEFRLLCSSFLRSLASSTSLAAQPLEHIDLMHTLSSAAALTDRALLDGQPPKAYIENNLLASLGLVLSSLEKQERRIVNL